jgi:hypothetical protein
MVTALSLGQDAPLPVSVPFHIGETSARVMHYPGGEVESFYFEDIGFEGFTAGAASGRATVGGGVYPRGLGRVDAFVNAVKANEGRLKGSSLEAPRKYIDYAHG